MQKYSIIHKELAWFTTYLKITSHITTSMDRIQRNNICGVPQESCLRPLLFILRSPSQKSSQICMLMTDSLFGWQRCFSALEDRMNEIKSIKDWLRQNKLGLNVTKCEYMFIGNSKQLGKLSEEINNLKLSEDEILRVRKTSI